MFKILPMALRNIRRNLVRNGFVGGTIFFGALVMLVSLFLGDGITEGIIRNLVAIESGGVLVTYKKDDPVTKDPELLAAAHKQVSAALLAVPGKAPVRSRMRFDGLLFGPDGKSTQLVIKGIVAGQEQPLEAYLQPAAGRFLSDGNEIYLSRQAAEELNAEVGDSISLVANTWGDQINALDLVAVGIFENVAPWVDYTAFVPLPTAREIFGAEVSNQYLLDLPDLSAAPAAVAAARLALKDEPVRVRSYQDAGGFLLGIANANRYTFWGFNFLLYVVVALGIANLMSITVREREPELGVLMTMGYNARHLLGLLLSEIFVLAGIATAAALLVGAALYLWLATDGIQLTGVARNAFGAGRLQPALHLYQVVLVAGATLGMSLLGGIVPAAKAARKNTATILRKG